MIEPSIIERTIETERIVADTINIHNSVSGFAVVSIYKSEATKPPTPTGGSIQEGELIPPTGWTVAPTAPISDQSIWISVASESFLWSEPVKISGITQDDIDKIEQAIKDVEANDTRITANTSNIAIQTQRITDNTTEITEHENDREAHPPPPTTADEGKNVGVVNGDLAYVSKGGISPSEKQAIEDNKANIAINAQDIDTLDAEADANRTSISALEARASTDEANLLSHEEDRKAHPPPPTTADDGKVVGVSGGDLAFVDQEGITPEQIQEIRDNSAGIATNKAEISKNRTEISIRGLPSGGDQSQILSKISSDDYAVRWVDPTGGAQGENGWSPLISLEPRGSDIVMRIINWTGGGGAKPPTGYIGENGTTQNKSDARDVRGEIGQQGVSITSITIDNGQESSGRITYTLTITLSNNTTREVSFHVKNGGSGTIEQPRLPTKYESLGVSSSALIEAVTVDGVELTKVTTSAEDIEALREIDVGVIIASTSEGQTIQEALDDGKYSPVISLVEDPSRGNIIQDNIIFTATRATTSAIKFFIFDPYVHISFFDYDVITKVAHFQFDTNWIESEYNGIQPDTITMDIYLNTGGDEVFKDNIIFERNGSPSGGTYVSYTAIYTPPALGPQFDPSQSLSIKINASIRDKAIDFLYVSPNTLGIGDIDLYLVKLFLSHVGLTASNRDDTAIVNRREVNTRVGKINSSGFGLYGQFGDGAAIQIPTTIDIIVSSKSSMGVVLTEGLPDTEIFDLVDRVVFPTGSSYPIGYIEMESVVKQRGLNNELQLANFRWGDRAIADGHIGGDGRPVEQDQILNIFELDQAGFVANARLLFYYYDTTIDLLTPEIIRQGDFERLVTKNRKGEVVGDHGSIEIPSTLPIATKAKFIEQAQNPAQGVNHSGISLITGGDSAGLTRITVPQGSPTDTNIYIFPFASDSRLKVGSFWGIGATMLYEEYTDPRRGEIAEVYKLTGTWDESDYNASAVPIGAILTSGSNRGKLPIKRVLSITPPINDPEIQAQSKRFRIKTPFISIGNVRAGTHQSEIGFGMESNNSNDPFSIRFAFYFNEGYVNGIALAFMSSRFNQIIPQLDLSISLNFLQKKPGNILKKS